MKGLKSLSLQKNLNISKEQRTVINKIWVWFSGQDRNVITEECSRALHLGADGFNVLIGPASNMSAHECGQDSEGERKTSVDVKWGWPSRHCACTRLVSWSIFSAHVNVYRFWNEACGLGSFRAPKRWPLPNAAWPVSLSKANRHFLTIPNQHFLSIANQHFLAFCRILS